MSECEGGWQGKNDAHNLSPCSLPCEGRGGLAPPSLAGEGVGVERSRGRGVMRWRVRSQLLVPPLLLLAGISGVSVWMAWASAERARARLETRVRDVARNLCEESNYPLAENVLGQMKNLSGADFVLVPRDGRPVSTLGVVPEQLPPPEAVVTDWRRLRLEGPVRVGGRTYLCGGVRLVRPPRNGETLYIFYPETLWR